MENVSFPLDLVKVVQLPVIEEHLPILREQIERMTADALSLACTDETLISVKGARAQLNKSHKAVDDVKKQIEADVLKPLESFRKSYKENVTLPFATADKQLKEKIDIVEAERKLQKQEEVEEYFNEYSKAKGIDFVSFKQLRLNITMSASLKLLKNQVKEFLDNVIQDLALIATQPHSPEILIEYRKSLNASQSILTVQERYKALEELKAKSVMAEAGKVKKAEIEQKVDEAIQEFSAPKTEEAEPEENEPIYEATFTVRGTMGQLKALKAFLKEGEYDYE